MSPQRAVFFAVLLVLPSVVTAGEGEEPAAFEGYSRRAEAVVDRILRAYAQVENYQDKGVVKMDTGMPWGNQESRASVSFARPGRFRLETDERIVLSDGKQLTTYQRAIRRYKQEPLGKDPYQQVKTQGMAGGASIVPLLLATDARAAWAERFRELDLDGEEEIDGDRCILLAGKGASTLAGIGDDEVPVVIYVRKSDSMIRRVEIDLLEAFKKQVGEEAGFLGMLSKYLNVYDVKDLKINEKPKEDAFAFKAPAGAKKVDRFYTGQSATEGAVQFALSGHEAPDFELESVSGDWLSLEDYRGRVVVLNFLSAQPFFRRGNAGLGRLAQLQKDMAGQDFVLLNVHPDSDAERLLADLPDEQRNMTVLLDPGRATTVEYFEGRFASGVVLVGKNGMVQGRYTGTISEPEYALLKTDVEKLLKGETLPGGKPMTEEQLAEAAEQTATRFSSRAADPVNETHLEQAWSVRAIASGSFGFGGRGSAPTGGELWVRDRGVVRRIGPDGSVTAEVTIAEPTFDQFSQDSFVAGNLGGRMGVVYMKTIPGDGDSQFGFVMPKGATLAASDSGGDLLWEIEVESTNNQLPSSLTLADLDGRRGGELLFVHQQALWILDGRGEILARKPIPGSAQWILAEDRDHDRRAEIYLRTDQRLIRWDYRPQR